MIEILIVYNIDQMNRKDNTYHSYMVSELSLDIIESRRTPNKTVKNISSIYRRK
jgi:hypothetical protein